MKKSTKISIAIVLANLVAMILIIVFNVQIVFNVTSSQTEKIGSIQMENIGAKLENTFSNAKELAGDVAYEVDVKIAQGTNPSTLNTYFEETKAEFVKDGNCINVYAAGEDWYIIPDFEAPDGFVAQERLWYTGAISSEGAAYITQPYMDLAYGGPCFTVSRVLEDTKTVIALDFNLNTVQEYMKELSSNGTAIIVAESGEIAGYADSSLLGTNIADSLPQFEDIFNLEKKNQNSVVLTRTINGKTQTIFCSKTDNNWYLILCVENTALYSNSYAQLTWICVVNCALIVAILGLYGFTRMHQMKAEKKLQARNEAIDEIQTSLLTKISKIIDYAQPTNDETSMIEKTRSIQDAAMQMNDVVGKMRTIENAKTEDKIKKPKKEHKLTTTNRRVRAGVVTVIFAAMCVTVALVATSNYNLGKEKMQEEANHYQNELSQWVTEQKSILSMFVNAIAANPEILDDYDTAVEFLNDITIKYDDISCSYMTNPDAPHTVIMNNGWDPDNNPEYADWHVETRDWYIATLNSKDGFNISSPYQDSQTGKYCITFSQIVYNKNNDFLGIFGIDFYMGSLINILSESYNDSGYAFLVDANGNIVNHPYAFYQMNDQDSKNVLDSQYKHSYASERVISNIQDYDGKAKVCISEKDQVSGFTIIVVKNWWNMFGSIVLYSILFVVMFGSCMGAVWYLISKLIIWQTQVNTQLQEAAEKATEAGKAKSRFLAQMSHEIRTPINAVLGMNELISRETSDDTIRDYSNDIQAAGRTLLSLINSILDFSKIEDGKMEIVPVDYDTSSLINDLVNMTSERSKAKNLELKLDIDSNIPARLFGDDVRLRQIIVNLLTNSIKYTEQGSVTLKMEVTEKLENTIKLHVSVVDTGIGIKEEDRDKLCLSFSRLDQERNHGIEGTGLGLSIVTKLLTMMGSQLQIESEYGKGSNFFFDVEQGIVLDEPIGDYSARRKIANASVVENYLYAPTASILAVDDNDMNLKVVRGLLKRNGIVPDIAASGLQCIEMANHKHYDIILLDHMMPVMDGIETRQKLEEKGLVKDTVVIVLTANAIVGAKEMYLEAGFADYLSKPIDAAKLEEKLEKYLPQEKLESKKDEKAEQVQTSSQNETSSQTEESGPSLIDTQVGLNYCANDEDMYFEILSAYLEEGASNIEKLDSYYEKQDWKNYAIIAHAVKSTSRTIGAASLGDLAYQHELAGKEDNAEEIDKTYVDFLTLYQRVLGEVEELIKSKSN